MGPRVGVSTQQFWYATRDDPEICGAWVQDVTEAGQTRLSELELNGRERRYDAIWAEGVAGSGPPVGPSAYRYEHIPHRPLEREMVVHRDQPISVPSMECIVKQG